MITQKQENRNMLLLFTLVLFPIQFTSMIPLPEGNFVGATSIAKPGCRTKCGDVTVPYPFGINTIVETGGNETKHDCSLEEPFELTCNLTSHPPKLLYVPAGIFEIYNISETEIRMSNFITYKCYDKSGGITSVNDWGFTLSKTPYIFSQKNKLTVIGCDDYALMTADYDGAYSSGCLGFCSQPSDVRINETCSSGNGCCQTSIPKGLKSMEVDLFSFNNHTIVHSVNPCGVAFLSEEERFKFRGPRNLSYSEEFLEKTYSLAPMVLDWVIGGNRSCAHATECKGNSTCKDAENGGYHCICEKGYEGNPYLDPGCQDINECENPSNDPCHGPHFQCNNVPGSYNCSCKPGFTGNLVDGCQSFFLNSTDGYGPPAEESKFLALEISLALVFGLLVIFSVITGIYFGIRKRNLIKLREKFFEQNGGVFLKQKLKAPGATDTVTMFSTQQLRKATDNYSEERIVGRGGSGVVYKGFLPDKRIVAIKKSILVDGSQSEQFINEVLILTQVIHRNVVNLLGCCLEEEVPVLVYEFISNNTLYHHLHSESGGMSWLSWENRLRVAAEAASALAYLHSQAAMPIIHRDVKCANILLDENYTTKISDFGASRLVPLDHDQVTTLVQGTLGYLDPEYFHTSQLTGKSDVYSFGVVLAELITGQKPLSVFRTDEDKNLATYFVKSMEENRLFQIVDPRVIREGTLDQLQAVAELIRRCVSLEGKNRPTMKDVAMELEGLRKFTTHPWVPQQTPEESTSLILEDEQSDLYGSPLIPYSSNEWDSYSGMTEMTFQENKPR